LADGLVIHLDLALVGARLGLEVDHSMWHAERAASRRDKARDRAAAR
jgi:hypothetical protein